MRAFWFIVAFALAHMAATVFSGMSALGAAMSGFEAGTVHDAASGRVYSAATDVLLFPLGAFVPRSAPPALGYMFLFMNGALWGGAILAVSATVAHLRRRRRRSDPHANQR